ncbi:hypothetical protein [Dyella acidiphila]|uniref:Uncharacterized protein n=1 Tax=Dyella acidiphila TaxID=2775866 RepID=A0ABR9GCV1_9GAMM|nr:hypothetical protein [Dyella acidiphila]MBE1161867.1 hypothetical protein [Dyella acidiphila]
MNIQIGVAGVPEELELRLSLACGLLAAAQLQVHLQAWKGRPCQLLVVDLDNGYGRLACEVAKRRDIPVLCFDTNAPNADGMPRIDRHAPAASMARTLQELLLPGTAAVEGVDGLLGICLHEIGCDEEVLARHGHIAVVVRHAAGRIHARSMSELLAAEARLLDGSWLSGLRPQQNEREYEWLVSRSLESFLVMACRRHQASLPLLDGAAYRLRRWPDLGGVADDLDSLRLAALLYRSAWRMPELAQHTRMDARQVNAFLWATLVSGALHSDEAPVSPAFAATAPLAAPSILRRVARHFGLRIGHVDA